MLKAMNHSAARAVRNDPKADQLAASAIIAAIPNTAMTG